MADRSRQSLPARVIANRIWHYHFGKGIVATTSDFGVRGTAPTHPELLDYLAARFIEDGWSFKKMHKLILMSETYQLASADVPPIPQPIRRTTTCGDRTGSGSMRNRSAIPFAS